MHMCLSNSLFHLSASDYGHFMGRNAVGGIALIWVSGISFMLVVTLSMLQLREVLHPDILSPLIRPQVHLHAVCTCHHDNDDGGYVRNHNMNWFKHWLKTVGCFTAAEQCFRLSCMQASCCCSSICR